MTEEKICPILTIGEAALRAPFAFAAGEQIGLARCRTVCEGENCAMHERCVPTMLTLGTIERTAAGGDELPPF